MLGKGQRVLCINNGKEEEKKMHEAVDLIERPFHFIYLPNDCGYHLDNVLI